MRKEENVLMTWNDFIEEESQKEYFKELMAFVKKEYACYKCHPDFDDIFNAYRLTPLDKVKVVILGQDPYHNDNEAHGLSFSVKNAKNPPSLKNIYKEIASDLGCEVEESGDLTYLAKQGVFLLNTTLTVRHNEPLSHYGHGWETFTDNTIKLLNSINKPIVFILWGNNARKKAKMLDNPNHLIIESAHPSPLGAYHGFFGSKPFSKANDFLIKNNLSPIKWANKANKRANLFDFN